MRAALMIGNDQPLVFEELGCGPLGAHDVEVRIDATGVCRSDLNLLSGFMPPPAILGHEGVGTVVEVGASVRRVRVGDRVIGAFTPECGDCWYCRHDLPQHCERAFEIAVVHRYHRHDGTGVMGASGLGTFTEVMRTHEASLVAVETDLPVEQLALIGCAVTTGVGAALNTARVEPASSCAVIGCGGVGGFVVQGCRVAGAAMIVAVDPDPAKRAAALAVGATHEIDPTVDDVPRALRAMTGGRGVDYAFEVVGRPEVVQQAFKSTRAAGTTVIVGMPDADSRVELPLFRWFHGEKRVLGCNYGSAHVRRDFERLIKLTEAGALDIASAVTAVRPLDEVNQAIADLRAGAVVRSVLRP